VIGHGFQITKWWSGGSSMATIPGLEKYNYLLLLKSFQLGISTSTALNTSPLCKYYTRASLLIREVSGQRGGVHEGCNSLIYWVWQGCRLKSLLESSWRHPLGPRLCNITDFYHFAMMHPLKHFYTPLSGAPQKCFKSGPALANAGPDRSKPSTEEFSGVCQAA